MKRLGYTRYVAQGGDQGAAVTDDLARLAPDGLVGIHLNLLRTALGSTDGLPTETDEERAALDALGTFRPTGFGYFLEQSTRPQTIGYALLDSPVALAALDARPRHRQLLQDRRRLRRGQADRATSPATTCSTTSRSTG